jgi:hypothetical protein
VPLCAKGRPRAQGRSARINPLSPPRPVLQQCMVVSFRLGPLARSGLVEVADVNAQLDALVQAYEDIRKEAQHDDLSGGSPESGRAAHRLCVRTMAASSRLLPAGTTYRRQADQVVEAFSGRGYITNPGGLILQLFEVLRAFRDDAAAGFLAELEASINARVFSDFLDMAEHVLAEVHRTPAAVVAGFTLEEHLRKMCGAAGVALTHPDGSPKKADLLNAELAKAGAYPTKTEGKDVTAWLGRRNDAAHGHHDRYSEEQVRLMIEGVRNFISRHPA